MCFAATAREKPKSKILLCCFLPRFCDIIVGHDTGSPPDLHLNLVIALLLFKFITFLLYVYICVRRYVSSIEALNQQES